MKLEKKRKEEIIINKLINKYIGFIFGLRRKTNKIFERISIRENIKNKDNINKNKNSCLN